jgi:hypothetical protein
MFVLKLSGIQKFFYLIFVSTTLPGCAGLETGHGNMPDYGIYQCYGRVRKYLYSYKKEDTLGCIWCWSFCNSS